MRIVIFIAGVVLAASLFPGSRCYGDDIFDSEDSILKDRNQDDEVSFMIFGNSIAFGVGDGTAPGAFVEKAPKGSGGGAAERIRITVGINTDNAGVPGEVFTANGISRLPAVVSSSRADLIGFLEGSNDANGQVSVSEYRLKLQRAVNTIKALGKEVVLATLPPPCCNHSGLTLFTRAYSKVIRETASINGVRIADAERAWENSCPLPSKCELHNIPEGLHPNTKGYDVIAQTFMAAFLDIDIFSGEGGPMLEEALGLEPGSVIVEPDH